jgi:hypothetical protein
MSYNIRMKIFLFIDLKFIFKRIAMHHIEGKAKER